MSNESVALVTQSEALKVKDCDDLIGLELESINLADSNDLGSAGRPTFLLFKEQLLELKSTIDEAVAELEASENAALMHQ